MPGGDAVCYLSCKALPGGRTVPYAVKHCWVRMVRLDEGLGHFFTEYVEIGGICDDAKAEEMHKLRPGPAVLWAWVWPQQPCWGPCQGFLLG